MHYQDPDGSTSGLSITGSRRFHWCGIGARPGKRDPGGRAMAILDDFACLRALRIARDHCQLRGVEARCRCGPGVDIRVRLGTRGGGSPQFPSSAGAPVGIAVQYAHGPPVENLRHGNRGMAEGRSIRADPGARSRDRSGHRTDPQTLGADSARALRALLLSRCHRDPGRGRRRNEGDGPALRDGPAAGIRVRRIELPPHAGAPRTRRADGSRHDGGTDRSRLPALHRLRRRRRAAQRHRGRTLGGPHRGRAGGGNVLPLLSGVPHVDTFAGCSERHPERARRGGDRLPDWQDLDHRRPVS